MNNISQQEQLNRFLTDSSKMAGIYLLDTDLTDDVIEKSIKRMSCFSYYKCSLSVKNDCPSLEWLIIKLCLDYENDEIKELRNCYLCNKTINQDNLLYVLLELILRELSSGKCTIIHICGKYDLTSLSNEDISILNDAISSCIYPILIVNKKKALNPAINIVSFRETSINNKKMNRTEVLHISYKHDPAYENALKSIQRGLEKNNIPYSIDKYDIMYRDNIDDYEKEIGRAACVVMFVVPSYLKSLDCMFEMTEMLNNGNVKERIFPVVDMGGIPRNGDGLIQIKDYWQGEKVRKSEQIKMEPGGSSFVIDEIKKIDDIIKTLDVFWSLICRNSTGNFDRMVENDAALLIEELHNKMQIASSETKQQFVPTMDTKPQGFRTIIQNGENSIYFENNTGTINIS